ncbi:hypothetical protein LPB140_03480 [Sphingorhabdus lutea]|uniref:SDR family oxidoreductase n=1 Tax=Sphingorhabdus lutea TaxID=1913578 RepID=A0A1L3JA78_9SPHN|nr:SDR family NAD(P)-dependent oxidoreductase [Sphingorhabdus lutea]APG62031.1 hypothetical protein LPB140_03480 [Sphingorhabdus lutea]
MLIAAAFATCANSQLIAAGNAANSNDTHKIDLTGKTILITGAATGFGRLGAIHYARLGAKVIATMRNIIRPEAAEISDIAKNEKLDIHIVEIDVLSEHSVQNGVAQAEKILGAIPDVLINNAGIAIVGPVEAQDLQASKLAFDTNIIGYQLLQRAVLPAMRKRRSGHIINMSSQSGRIIYPGLGHYCPTKFAVEAMSEALAYEVALQGVEISIIQAGGYPTEFWRNREQYTAKLKQRSATEHLDGYGAMADLMGSGRIPKLNGDPMDVPRAIAHAIAAPAGRKPLRVMVSSSNHPQAQINDIIKETQLSFLQKTPYGNALKILHN